MEDHDRLGHLDAEVRVLAAELEALDRLISDRFIARDKAIEVVAAETARVQAQQNEWRATLTDLAARQLDADEYSRAHGGLVDRFNVLQSRVDAAEGGSSAASRTAMWIAIGISLLSLIAVIVSELTR